MSAAKTIFITGASSGIGLASAKLFHELGWNVVATMRTPEKDTELKALDPARMLVARLDLQDYTSIQPAIQAGIHKFSTIDVLLNNAGYGQNGLFEAIPRETVQQQFDVNLFGESPPQRHRDPPRLKLTPPQASWTSPASYSPISALTSTVAS
jgi:NAD(P)-dependent dehydrogenase (short-subunit alcohol dehydrogenase family)